MELISKTIKMRPANVEDAEFILSLRLDQKYNSYISKVKDDIKLQKNWLLNYKAREREGKEYYFIIERNDGIRCGTVRLYDFVNNSFCWGSWILNEDKTRFSAIESAFLVYRFGFNDLGFSKSHFDVRKDNKRVISFHEKMGAVKVGETEDSYLFEISKEAVDEQRQKLIGKLQ